MYIGIMESESYDWMSLGRTAKEAKQAILDQWNNHQQCLVENNIQTKEEAEEDSFDTIEEIDNEYGISVTKINPGECKFW